jgi:hypothetical protein
MPIEIGRFEAIIADMIIGRLHADGIAAFPLPSSGRYGQPTLVGILVEDEDADAARSIIATGATDFPG